VHETFVTVMGNVASRPRSALTKSGHPVTSFRLASTPRRFDRARGVWADGPTSWFTVTCWRSLAEHVASSVGVGDPVVVHGRMQVKDYTRGDGTGGTSVELDASSVGHDLTRGTSMFKKGEARAGVDGEGPDTTAEDLARLVAQEEEGTAEPDVAAAPAADAPARAA
jgi:single-strand DNA-binding protein